MTWSRHRVRSMLGWLAAGVMIACVLLGAWWRLSGGSWLRVETPSMGTVAPVGSLLWVAPVQFDDLAVGDFISFVPPDGPEGIYSHFVYAVHADGTITTKGVIPGPDPWRLTEADVVGKVEMAWWGVGWIVEAIPVLVFGGLLVTGICLCCKRTWRTSVAIMGIAATVSIAITVFQPLLGAQRLAVDQLQRVTEVTFVGTGALPVEIREPEGNFVVLGSGELGTLAVPNSDALFRVELILTPVIPWWWWVLIVGGCFAPAIVELLRTKPREFDSLYVRE